MMKNWNHKDSIPKMDHAAGAAKLEAPIELSQEQIDAIAGGCPGGWLMPAHPVPPLIAVIAVLIG